MHTVCHISLFDTFCVVLVLNRFSFCIFTNTSTCQGPAFYEATWNIAAAKPVMERVIASVNLAPSINPSILFFVLSQPQHFLVYKMRGYNSITNFHHWIQHQNHILTCIDLHGQICFNCEKPPEAKNEEWHLQTSRGRTCPWWTSPRCICFFAEQVLPTVRIGMIGKDEKIGKSYKISASLLFYSKKQRTFGLHQRAVETRPLETMEEYGGYFLCGYMNVLSVFVIWHHTNHKKKLAQKVGCSPNLAT